MTQVTFFTASDGTFQGFESSGHADGKRVKGYDLVCCAVSALTQTGVNALEAVAGITPEVRISDGYLECLLPETESTEQKSQAQTILSTILTGLKDIEKVYPKHVRIQYKERRQ